MVFQKERVHVGCGQPITHRHKHIFQQPMMRDETDKVARLDALRKHNAERWEVLKNLHPQKATQPCAGIEATLRAEKDMLGRTLNPSQDFLAGPEDFLRQVVSSHDQLRQTNAVLSRQVERESTKLARVQAELEHYRDFSRHVLLEAQESARQESQRREETESEVRRESQWLRDELEYVSNILEDVKVSTIKREVGSESDAPGQPRAAIAKNAMTWSLSQLVMALVDRVLASPSDPYLLMNRLPINPEHLESLLQCGVVVSHESDRNLIRLTDYIGTS